MGTWAKIFRSQLERYLYEILVVFVPFLLIFNILIWRRETRWMPAALITTIVLSILIIALIIWSLIIYRRYRTLRVAEREPIIEVLEEEEVFAIIENYKRKLQPQIIQPKESTGRKTRKRALTKAQDQVDLLQKSISTCLICKLEIRQNQATKQCPNCDSLFHKNHLLNWLEEHNNCPVCSQAIR
ncbi:MAG: hypothetical protein E3J70_12170 [Candidatus Heimdallarchaeota archaeon]|nr:MAG: hypothetical protein E3J70_12170 [Candidatus Heimdallarchaeota archaeon]